MLDRPFNVWVTTIFIKNFNVLYTLISFYLKKLWKSNKLHGIGLPFLINMMYKNAVELRRLAKQVLHTLTLLELSARIPHLFACSWCSESQGFQVLTHDLNAVTLTERFTLRLWRYRHSMVYFTAIEVHGSQLLPDPLSFSFLNVIRVNLARLPASPLRMRN